MKILKWKTKLFKFNTLESVIIAIKEFPVR